MRVEFLLGHCLANPPAVQADSKGPSVCQAAVPGRAAVRFLSRGARNRPTARAACRAPPHSAAAYLKENPANPALRASQPVAARSLPVEGKREKLRYSGEDVSDGQPMGVAMAT